MCFSSLALTGKLTVHGINWWRKLPGKIIVDWSLSCIVTNSGLEAKVDNWCGQWNVDRSH